MPQNKKQNQKMSLGNFLSDQSLGSWADEMDDMPIPSSAGGSGYGAERRDFSSRSFGGELRGLPPREQLPLPTKPPYTAHLGNLSWDVTQNDIQDFFAGCEVTNVRIVEDKVDRKPKGFGYVEFASLEGLKKALELNNTNFQTRVIRISVAEPPKDSQRGDARELGDWTRKGPLPELPNQRRVSDRAPYRSFDAASDAGSERSERRRPPPFEQGDGKVRDFGNWERKGPLSPVTAPTGPQRDGRSRVAEKSFERRSSPSSQDGGSRPPRPKPERQPTAAELDNQWRARMKPDPTPKSPTSTPTVSTPSSPAAPAPVAPVGPAVRPKLNLQKRTVSDAHTGENTPASASDSRASPFGAARPIDTATREKEVEEKRIALRQKKEEDDKVREEKIRAEKAEKAAKGEQVVSSPKISAPPSRENGKVAMQREDSKENGTASQQAGKSYEILRRMTDQEDDAEPGEAEDDAPGASANGTIVDDKEVKPQEVVKDITAQDAPATTGGEKLDEDGWTSVETRGKRNRRSINPPARALAS